VVRGITNMQARDNQGAQCDLKRRKSDSDGGLDDDRNGTQLIDFSPKKVTRKPSTEDEESLSKVEVAKNYYEQEESLKPDKPLH
jgi:hypothetical protein